jgi:hypothetical protein
MIRSFSVPRRELWGLPIASASCADAATSCAFLLGADLLIHPAYNENTGTVLLEAVVAGLPVLTTAVCGYAHYIAPRPMPAVVSRAVHAARARPPAGADAERRARAPALARATARLCRSRRHLQQCRTCGRRDPERALMSAGKALSRRALPLVVGGAGSLRRRRGARRRGLPRAGGAPHLAHRSRRARLLREDPSRHRLGRNRSRTSLSLRLPVLGAANEWRAIQRLRELGVDSMRAVAFGCAAAIRRGNCRSSSPRSWRRRSVSRTTAWDWAQHPPACA